MINRLEATRYLVEQFCDEPIIASCGNPKFDLFTTAAKRKSNFYMWNSMGMASSIGLGLAMARPDKRVIVLDGDGATCGTDLDSCLKFASHTSCILVQTNDYGPCSGQRYVMGLGQYCKIRAS